MAHKSLQIGGLPFDILPPVTSNGTGTFSKVNFFGGEGLVEYVLIGDHALVAVKRGPGKCTSSGVHLFSNVSIPATCQWGKC